ncbi:hypothetical protein P7C71_g5513, partial [Lecanoromycetidae sp. Uapishka_2]
MSGLPASQYPEQIQRRVAAVRYDSDFSSPTKKRRIGSDSVPLSSAASVAPMFGQQKIQVVVDSPHSSEDEPTPTRKSAPKSATRRQEPILSATTAVRNGHTTFDVESEEDIVPTRQTRRSRAAPLELSSDEDTAPQALRGPLTPKKKEEILKTLHRDFEAEKDSPEDLHDEVEDLQGTSDIEITETRTRGRFADAQMMERQNNSARSIRQQKLEKLRRRRAGIKDNDTSDEEGGQDSADEDETSETEPFQEAIRRGDDLDEYEEDFVDDENETIGVDLGRAGVPLEFTYHANKKTIDHFTTEIEWMVHNKINPAFDRYDEIYLLAHDKLDTEFQGFAGSKFISSVWSQDFDKALKTRPDFYRADVPTMHEHKCDACNRSNHPPKHRVTFSGKAYDRKTLEVIEHEGDEDDDSEDSSKDEESSPSTVDEQSFFLGRFCCSNAEIAHALYHWRYALNQNVLQWLANEGHLTPEKIIEREKKPQKKRQKIANKIVDGMESTGVMRELYKQFKENLAAARDAKPVHFSNRR